MECLAEMQVLEDMVYGNLEILVVYTNLSIYL